MGPAAAGKSTFCSTILRHCESLRRPAHLFNLDPAADGEEASIDIRDLVTVGDVMEELGYGPNGGLIFALEYLLENLDWLESQLGDFTDDYLVIDCPGQIELYTHFPIMRQFVQFLQRMDYRVCGIYVLDSQFIQDPSKFFSGILSATSAMIQLEIPHINVLSKVDLLGEFASSHEFERYLDPDPSLLLQDVNSKTRPKFARLNEAILRLIEEYNMVSFIPLNIRDEDSIDYVLSHIDNALQFHEDQEPKEPHFDDTE